MIKIYKANTDISINVLLPSKKNLHISFTPLSNNGSTFTTDNEDVINAIERHYQFGRLFKVSEVIDEELLKAKVQEKKDDCPSAKVDGDVEVLKVKVSDFASAKDYLADNFGISRTSLRSMKAIIEQGAAHGVEFEGLSIEK